MSIRRSCERYNYWWSQALKRPKTWSQLNWIQLRTLNGVDVSSSSSSSSTPTVVHIMNWCPPLDLINRRHRWCILTRSPTGTCNTWPVSRHICRDRTNCFLSAFRHRFFRSDRTAKMSRNLQWRKQHFFKTKTFSCSSECFNVLMSLTDWQFSSSNI